MFMTTKILTGYTAVIITVLAFALVGITFAYASEVTGTLSSDAVGNSLTSGSLAGNVTGNDNGNNSSGGGGRSGSSNRGSSNNSPDGSVLGASTSNVLSPAFPNAGYAPDEINQCY